MVDCHGSQCGFCTPGFVMSLWTRSQGAEPGTPVPDVLAGNLCRCTGYGAILAAAEQADAAPQVVEPDWSEALASLPADSLALEFGGRRWFSPRSIEELAGLALEHPEAVILAGATDVGLWVTKQHRRLDTVIYLGEVAELSTLTETADHLRIGAGVRYGDAFRSLAAHYPGLGEMMRRLGSVQVRNSGTIGGNVANGSPIGDMPPALIALGATLVLRRGTEVRRMPLEDYFLAYGKQDRRPGEFVEAVEVPRLRPDQLYRVYKLSKRFDQDISAVCLGLCVRLDGGVEIGRAHV